MYLCIQDLCTGKTFRGSPRDFGSPDFGICQRQRDARLRQPGQQPILAFSKHLPFHVDRSEDVETPELAIPLEGKERLFNSSVCRDEQGYAMAYESNLPLQWCFKFARSKDLAKWEKVPGLVFAGPDGKEVHACPGSATLSPTTM